MKTISTILLAVAMSLACRESRAQQADSVLLARHDSTEVQAKRPGFIKRIIDSFSDLDTSYIEPNHYNWAVMLQNTNTFDWLNLYTRNGTLTLSPDPVVKIAPYFGYRWLFLGYSFSLNDTGRRTTRTEFEFSVYTNRICFDAIYRKTGEDFKWRQSLSTGSHALPDGKISGGVSMQTLGLNVFYVFNNRHFSLPAMFSQSTVQKRSCGSWLAGASVTRHHYDFNSRQWPADAHVFDDEKGIVKFGHLDYALSGGYGYNWVLRRGLTLCCTVMPAIGYKHVTSMSRGSEKDNEEQSRWGADNINLDISARAALVWNTNKYFAGLSLLVHNYNYKHGDMSIHNTFGTLNVYVGLNFNKRKEFRDKKIAP